MDVACDASSPGACLPGDGPSADPGGGLAFGATTAALSAAGLSTLLLMQLDGFSRRLLAAPRLLAKRRREYKYVSEQSSEFNALLVRQHVGGGSGGYDPRSEASAWLTLTKSDGDEMDEVVAEILDAAKPSPVVAAMEQDLADEADPNTHHLFLAFPPISPAGGTATPAEPRLCRRVRVPLVEFCERLATAFEGQMTSTALCFVADASSGLGSETLVEVVRSCDHGVATISDPAWMTSLSLLLSKINKTHNITVPQFERVVFALCRLEAWRVRAAVGRSRTVLFALPGQACVPLLLPIIQRVFVHERHVFVYDGACYSVETGLALRKKHGTSYRQRAKEEVWEAVSASPRVISSTFPMVPLRHNRELPHRLADLNGAQASIMEAWIAAVDVFLEMKVKEKKNFYAPFTCRMGFLMKRSGIGNGKGDDLSEMALKNVLEYVTGSKSRALPDEVMERAVSCLTEMREKYEESVKGSRLSCDEKVLIEKCVFAHKSILIGEKTLLDTVQPKEGWSLKAAKKLKSCLCCLPGEGDEEDEEGSDADDDKEGNEDGGGSRFKEGIDLSVPGAFATAFAVNNRGGRPKYVDGKTQFAFDPTAFNMG